MNRITLLLIAILIYIIGASYFWACVIKGHCNNSEPYVEAVTNFNKNTDIPVLKISDGNNFKIVGKDNIIFEKSQSGAIIKNSVDSDLNRLATYLKDNAGKSLYLTGLYKSGEANGAGLGTKRAEDIKAKLVAKGVSASSINVGTKANNGLYEANNLIYGAVDFSFNKPSGFASSASNTGNLVVTPSTSISDGALNVNVNDAILFDRNSDKAKVSSKVSDALKNTADYLNKNSNRNLKLTGLYDRSEKNNTQLPNLGLARAEAVKSELVKKGAKASQISTTYRLERIPFKTGFVEYGFNTKDEIAKYEQELLAKVESKIQNIGSMNIYFETGSDNIALNNELANFIDDVKYYLLKKPTEKVRLIGHTDSTGDAAKNIELGRGRANTIKDYFVAGGVKANQISVSSEGPNRPIDSNETEEGRAKNRRVEISIK